MKPQKAPKKNQAPEPRPSPAEHFRQLALWAALGWAAFVTAKCCFFWVPLDAATLFSVLPSQTFFPRLSALFLYLKGLFFWAGILAGCLAWGDALARPLAVDWRSALERAVFSLALGFGAVSLAVLLLAALHVFYPLACFLLWISGVILLFVLLGQDPGLKAWLAESGREAAAFLFGNKSPLLLRVFLWIFLALGFVMALVPELFYDALVYHLGYPNCLLQAHGLLRVPGVTSKFPMLWQLLYGYGLGLCGDEIVPKLLHWTSGLGVVLGFCAFAARLSLPVLGALAGVLFLSVPMVQMNLWTSGVDIGGCFFALLAVYAACVPVLRDRPAEGDLSAPPSRDLSWIVLAAAMSAFSYGSKYQGGITAALVFLVLAVFAFKKTASPFQSALAFASVGLLLVLPWLAKNLWDAGNPFFPYLSGFFAKIWRQKEVMTPHQIQWLHDENVRFVIQPMAQVWQRWDPRVLWKLAFENTAQSSLSYPGPIFLAVLPLALFGAGWMRPEAGTDARFSRLVRPLGAFLAVFFFVSFGVTHLTRYHLQGYPALCFFLALGIVPLWGLKSPLPKIFVLGLLSILLLENLQTAIYVVQNSYHPWTVLSGEEPREEYRSYSHPGLNPYPSNVMYRWAEANLPPESRILLIGETKPFNLKRPHVYTDPFGLDRVVTWAGTGSQEKMYEACRGEGVTHWMVNVKEAFRTYSYGMLWFQGPNDRAIFEDFWNRHVRLLHAEKIPEKFFPANDWVLLYEILPEEEARKKGPPPQNVISEIIRYNEKKG